MRQPQNETRRQKKKVNIKTSKTNYITRVVKKKIALNTRARENLSSEHIIYKCSPYVYNNI